MTDDKKRHPVAEYYQELSRLMDSALMRERTEKRSDDLMGVVYEACQRFGEEYEPEVALVPMIARLEVKLEGLMVALAECVVNGSIRRKAEHEGSTAGTAGTAGLH